MYINHSCNTLSFLILAKDILFGATKNHPHQKRRPSRNLDQEAVDSEDIGRCDGGIWQVRWSFEGFFSFGLLRWDEEKIHHLFFPLLFFVSDVFVAGVLFVSLCLCWSMDPKGVFFLGWKNLGWKKKHFPGLMPWRNLLIAQNSDLGKSWTSKADGSFGGWFGWWFLICARV